MKSLLLSALAALVLAGCTATPDLNGWAESSASLSNAVAEENKLALRKIDEAISKAALGKQEKWARLDGINVSQLGNDRDTYEAATVAINTGMSAMVRYADAVAALAAAGETGREASRELLSSLDTITKTVGAGIPLATPAGVAVGKVVGELADAVTRVQAQESLSVTMNKLQPDINRFRDRIIEYASVQGRVVRPIVQISESLLREEFGPERLIKARSAYLQMETIAKAGTGSASDAEKIKFLENESAYYRKFEKEKSALRSWRDQRQAAANLIASAARDWAQSHAEAARMLDKCGALRSLRAACGNYTAAKLKDAATKIQDLVTPFIPAT